MAQRRQEEAITGDSGEYCNDVGYSYLYNLIESLLKSSIMGVVVEINQAEETQ